MGRDAGFIALRTAIATGAEGVLVPEIETDLQDLESFIEKDYNPKNSSGIIIVAEGEKSGGAYSIAEKVAQKHPDYDIRVSVLGHMQRGGSPTQFDRVLASQLGVAAVDALMDDQKSIMVGIMSQKGNIHLNIGKPLTAEEIAEAAKCDKNDRYQKIRHAVDLRVIDGYKLWKNNYIAYDIANHSYKYSDKYERTDLEQFVAYMEGQLDTVEPEINREDLRRIFLDIYANPVVTKELLAKEKATGCILL
jgi:hypothetical protein